MRLKRQITGNKFLHVINANLHDGPANESITLRLRPQTPAFVRLGGWMGS